MTLMSPDPLPGHYTDQERREAIARVELGQAPRCTILADCPYPEGHAVFCGRGWGWIHGLTREERDGITAVQAGAPRCTATRPPYGTTDCPYPQGHAGRHGAGWGTYYRPADSEAQQ